MASLIIVTNRCPWLSIHIQMDIESKFYTILNLIIY